MLQVLLLLWVAVMVPLRVGFDADVLPFSPMWFWEACIDLCATHAPQTYPPTQWHPHAHLALSLSFFDVYSLRTPGRHSLLCRITLQLAPGPLHHLTFVVVHVGVNRSYFVTDIMLNFHTGCCFHPALLLRGAPRLPPQPWPSSRSLLA